MRIDLHIHTAASGDGELSPQEVVRLAKESSLRAIAVTDHDSVAAVEEALFWGERQGVEVVPACEFSTGYGGKWLHVLGYFLDIHHPAVEKWCQEAERLRRENVDEQIARLRAAGLYLEKERVLADGPQPMPICYSMAIFADGRNDGNPLVNQYKALEKGAIRFCLDWIATGRPYSAAVHLPAAPEVIGLIAGCGGVPVLAHPAATLGTGHDGLIGELAGCGLAGVEAFTTWHTAEQEDHYWRLCGRYGLIATCGSDFHGKNKPHVRIGQVRNNGYETVELLKDAWRKQAGR